MSIADLKVRLADVQGAETLTMGLEAGRIMLRWGAGYRPRSTLRHRLDDYNPDRSGGRRACYSKLLLQAKDQKRIEFVPVDPLMQVRSYFDIGNLSSDPALQFHFGGID
jgi:hypothetical protein